MADATASGPKIDGGTISPPPSDELSDEECLAIVFKNAGVTPLPKGCIDGHITGQQICEFSAEKMGSSPLLSDCNSVKNVGHALCTVAAVRKGRIPFAQGCDKAKDWQSGQCLAVAVMHDKQPSVPHCLSLASSSTP